MVKIALVLCIALLFAASVFWVTREDEDEKVPLSTGHLPRPALVTVPETTEAGEDEPDEPACDLVVRPSVSLVSTRDVAPGDVVCLESGVRGPLSIEDVEGSDTDPIVFRNDGGITVIEGDDGDYAGIDIRGSSHLVVSGAGMTSACGASVEEADQECGIVVRGTGRGLAATERSDHIKVDHLDISDTTHSGIFIKSGADEGVHRGDWTQRATLVVDNYLHDVGREGLYIGSSFYSKDVDPVLIGVRVARNLVIDSGWDGIQVGSAVAECSIEGNLVFGAGAENRDDQRAGIINNRGSVCSVLDNVIVESAAQGIYVQGNGGNLVGNNLVIQPGWLTPGEGDGITVSRGSNSGMPVSVVHNTIIDAPRLGVRFRLDVGEGNRVANNLFIAVGASITADEDEVALAGNVVVEALDEAGLEDPRSMNFGLTADSPAVDAGADLPGLPALDFTGWPRPDGAAFDAGAFEYRSGVDHDRP